MLWISVVRLLRTNYSALHSELVQPVHHHSHDVAHAPWRRRRRWPDCSVTKPGGRDLVDFCWLFLPTMPLVSKTYSSNSTESTTWLSLSHCRRVLAAGSHKSTLRDCFNILSFKPLDSLLAELSLSCFAGPNLRFFAFPSDSNNSWSSDLEVINAIREESWIQWNQNLEEHEYSIQRCCYQW